MLFACWTAPAKAELGFNVSDLSDLGTLLGPTVTKSFVKTIGMAIDHKAYEPATPLGTKIGLDISVEATAYEVPQDFKSALQSIGSNAGDSIPVLPLARLNVHKGLSETTSIGASYFGWVGYLLLGGDITRTLYYPDQGLTYAGRVAMAYGDVSFVKAYTLTPQILASKRMDFADPYIGLGYQIIWGKVTVPITNPIDGSGIESSASASSGSLIAFLGVGFRFGPTGIKLTLEGSFSEGGAHSLGTKFGFAF